MTILAEPPVGPALDARAFLLGDGGVDLLRERLRAAADLDLPDGPGGLPSRLRGALDEQVAEAAAGFLDVDLGATAVAGWRTYEQLLAAARETRRTPGLTTVVELAEHDLVSTWHPRLDVRLGGARLTSLAFTLTVAFHVVGLHAVVTAARLTRVGGGEGRVRAAFALGGRCLLEREAPFDARVGVPLGDGVPLLGSAEPRPEDAPSVVEGDDLVP